MINYKTYGITDFKNGKEKEAFECLEENSEELKKKYFDKFGNILSQDFAREVFKDIGYDRENSESTDTFGRPAWELVKLLFKEYHDIYKDFGNVEEIITGGIPGAGKTTSSREIQLDGIVSLIADINIMNYDETVKRIEQIIANGFKPVLNFIYRDPYEAYINGVLRRVVSKTGHIIKIDNQLKSYVITAENALRLIDKFGDGLKVVLSENKNGELIEISAGDLKSKNYKTEEFKERIINELERLCFEEREISRDIYESAIG